MNDYYPYQYPLYPGQAPAQQQQQQQSPSYFQTMPSFPPTAASYPPHTSTFDARPQTSGLYGQNQTMIPGLGYGHPQSFGWPQPQPQHEQTVSQVSRQQQSWRPPRETPNLIPAAQYYQSGDALKSQGPMASGALPPNTSKGSAKLASDDAEEGELNDGELDDVYEPQETLSDATDGRDSRAAANATRQNGHTSATYATAKTNSSLQNSGTGTLAAVDITERERSGSYSPHLSPREVHPHIDANKQQSRSSHPQALTSQASLSSIAGAEYQASKKPVEDARQRAKSAILNLWSLGVRHQHYVEEGIDKNVVKDFLNELELDPSSPGELATPGLLSTTQSAGPPHSHDQSSSQPITAITSGTISKPVDQQSAAAAASLGEERKDRIARLLAAKGAKLGSSTPSSGAQVIVASDKTAVQQQKQEALQKSREARAQKAAERKASQSKELLPTSSTHKPSTAAAVTPVGPSANQPAQTDSSQQQTAPKAPCASTIPGLSLSASQPAPVINQRKRPVAADFVSNVHTSTRPFGHMQQDKSFVIDISDASDDEDIEMEIGSPTDESTTMQCTDTPSRKIKSLRDLPLPTEGPDHTQLSSPAPGQLSASQSGVSGAQPPKQAHLHVMDKRIEAMKRKIALAEARAKLRAAMNGSQSGGPKPNGQTPDAALDPEGGKPGLPRVQSMDDASSSSDQPNGHPSPVAVEPTGSMALRKASHKYFEVDPSRAQRLRAVSASLPLIESRLQAKKSKLRLLQSQISRLVKDIEEEMAEKQKLAEEMEQFDQDSDESAGTQDHLMSNSVDPGVIPSLTESHLAMVQSPSPAPTAMTDNSVNTAAQSSNDAVIVRSLPAVTEHDHEASITPRKVAVAGKAATSPLEAPTSTNSPVTAAPEILANHVVTSREKESRPAISGVASDAMMGESDGLSSSLEQDLEPSSNASEPSKDTNSAAATKSPSISPVANGSNISLVNSDADLQQSTSRAPPIPEQISLGVNESTPDQGVGAMGEVPLVTPSNAEPSNGDCFTPYESPLRYFHAYRYHPKFAETVPGGLRSLTYSNRIDPKLPICPDQLARRDCPRGANCIYQHFESIKLPDDQILLQLGGTTLEGLEKANFNDGLRKLLQEMRAQNVKDFPSIAQGVVDYRNRFIGDQLKILPLGNISI